MRKAIRTTLSLVVSLVLFSSLTTAQAGGNNADKDKGKEHHSRLAKAAVWRHHKESDKNTKQATATHAQSTPAKTTKTAQIRPASTKQTSGKKELKQEQHASNTSKPASKKAPAANKAKSQQKPQDPKTVSLKP